MKMLNIVRPLILCSTTLFLSHINADESSMYVDASKERILHPGEKIKGSNYERFRRDYTIQRLSKNSYWVEVAIYQSLFYVGEKGVLIIDPLSYGRGEKLLDAIREVTDLPVTHIMYSHYHYDHVGDINFFKKRADMEGRELTIIGTKASVREINKYPGRVPLPNKVLDIPKDNFQFSGENFIVGTPTSGHSQDNSWILLEKAKVLHNVDMIHPGQLEFEHFSLSQEFWGVENALRELLEEDWELMNAGHGNIGSRSDVQFVLDYMSDMKSYTQELLPETPFEPYANPDEMIYGWFQGHRDEVAKKVVELMRPKWGKYPGFDFVALSHARQVYWQYVLH